MSIEREDLPTTIYTPDSAIANPRRLLGDMLRDLRASRELAWRLAVRDISAQYRQTALGFAWALLPPLALAAIWIFLGTSGVLNIGATAIPYPAFVLAGAMTWAIFTDAVTSPLQGVSTSRDMLARINFPREAIVISGLYQVAFGAAIKLLILLALLYALGVSPDIGLCLAPLGILVLVLAGTVLGLLITPLGLLYADVVKALPILLQFLLYLTPVIYPLPQLGPHRTLLLINPLTAPVDATRAWLTGGSTELAASLLLTGLGGVVLLAALWVVYRLAMPIVIERMSA